jgi:hypothetical protein
LLDSRLDEIQQLAIKAVQRGAESSRVNAALERRAA